MQSPTLLSDQIAHGSAAAHGRSGAWALLMNWRRNQTFADEAVDRARLIERHETGYGLAVVSHGHIVAVPHDAEIATEVVSEFSHAGFHPAIMALFREQI